MLTTRDEINNYFNDTLKPAQARIEEMLGRMKAISSNLDSLHVSTHKILLDIQFLTSGFEIPATLIELQRNTIIKLLRYVKTAKRQLNFDQAFIDDYATKGDGELKQFKDKADIILNNPAGASSRVNKLLHKVQVEVKRIYDAFEEDFEVYKAATKDLSNLMQSYDEAMLAVDKLFTLQKTTTQETPDLSNSPEAKLISLSKSLIPISSSSFSIALSELPSPTVWPSRSTTPTLGSSIYTHFAAAPSTQPADQAVTDEKPKMESNSSCNIM